MLKLAYCDFIGNKIREALLALSDNPSTQVGLSRVSPLKWDLSESGTLLSTKKTIRLADHNGKWYKVTIEEAS